MIVANLKLFSKSAVKKIVQVKSVIKKMKKTVKKPTPSNVSKDASLDVT